MLELVPKVEFCDCLDTVVTADVCDICRWRTTCDTRDLGWFQDEIGIVVVKPNTLLDSSRHPTTINIRKGIAIFLLLCCNVILSRSKRRCCGNVARVGVVFFCTCQSSDPPASTWRVRRNGRSNYRYLTCLLQEDAFLLWRLRSANRTASTLIFLTSALDHVVERSDWIFPDSPSRLSLNRWITLPNG